MKKLLSTLLAFLLCASMLMTGAAAFEFEILDPNEVFSDELKEQLSTSSWAREELKKAEMAGLITENTTFYKTHSITRFQFAELIVNAAEIITGKEIAPAPEGTFTDCGEAVVLKAYAAGIVNGMGDDTFEPDTTTNREQIATMIARAVSYIEKETGKTYLTQPSSFEKFADKGDVSDWAAEAMGLLAANSIMNGTSDTELSPKSPCTIEQSILLVYRFYAKTV